MLFLNRSMRARTLEFGRLANGPGTNDVIILRLSVILPIMSWKATTPLVAANVLVQCRLTLRRFGLFLRRENLIDTFTRLSAETVRCWKLRLVGRGSRLKQLMPLIGIGL